MKILPFPLPDDPVLQWLFEIARRADATAFRIHADRDADRQIWLRAELEVFEREERAKPRMPLMTAG